ncbi:unnamed protein product [Bursaphelenchus okinawaensis]|uniref:Uncharacterized protein n=1 Tax=Bursaphelenchus okinawaensis TaxID=465554 RepID=A0A811L9W2_9BILA|nr:unnamed protein product [Bursaphelenchus okinawaensis]CAG9121765.1 unnamed protein product [Bursaphelenchus okinawaensis]
MNNQVLSADDYLLVKVTHVLIDIAATMIETILLRFHPALWSKVTKRFPFLSHSPKVGKVRVALVDGTHVYFQQLQDSWK